MDWNKFGADLGVAFGSMAHAFAMKDMNAEERIEYARQSKMDYLEVRFLFVTVPCPPPSIFFAS